MASLAYQIPRIIRHFMPDSLVRFLLKRGWFIRPGMETNSPNEAAFRYIDTITGYNLSLRDQHVMIFGYGGQLSTGCLILSRGARHVTLVEREGFPLQPVPAELVERFPSFFTQGGTGWQPDSQYISLIARDIRSVRLTELYGPADLVFSSSVYEHLNDVSGITESLAGLTSQNGAHLHFIDLRDHFFSHPFEMLCYREATWRKWLNPTSNLNRFRTRDYLDVFQAHFSEVDLKVMERDLLAFERARERIRPEFLTGDANIDSVTLVHVFAKTPRQ